MLKLKNSQANGDESVAGATVLGCGWECGGRGAEPELRGHMEIQSKVLNAKLSLRVKRFISLLGHNPMGGTLSIVCPCNLLKEPCLIL